LIREYTLDVLDGDDLGEAWKVVVGSRKVKQVVTAEFGFAEEVLAMLRFVDGSFETGVGEALRPYRRIYQGNSELAAYDAFLKELLDLSYLEEEE